MITPALSRVLPRIQIPVVLAAMANASGGSLAAQVSNGGGFGFIGAALWSREKLAEEVATCQEQLQTSGVGRREFGIGFSSYKLTELHGKKPKSTTASHSQRASSEPSPAIDLIDAALTSRPRAIWLSFATDAEELVGWSRMIRERDEALSGRKEDGNEGNGNEDPIRLFIMVGTEKDVETAVRDCKADVVIVQGEPKLIEPAEDGS